VADSYRLVRSASTAADFHARPVPEPARCEIWWHEVTAPALVLGSMQSADAVDRDACRAAGIEVVRRRSGGGAVLLVPGSVTWIDVIVPAGSPGWADDIHVPMLWLGGHLAAVLGELMPERAIRVHEGAMVGTEWSASVCFDGLGAGEILLDGRKLVGISQRRTRHAARLQCCWYSEYDPADLVRLLDAAQRPGVADLAPVATVDRSIATRLPAVLVHALSAAP
jgi:lipoate-protein ligase A